MKIGILTFHCAHNYGAVLQAYAMQYFLIDRGYDAYIIDYRPKYLLDVFCKHSLKHWIARSISDTLVKLRTEPKLMKLRYQRYDSFNEFIRTYYRLIPYVKDLTSYFDVIVYGSDQIWNPKLTGGEYDPIFFGFSSNCKNIAYAASNKTKFLSQYDIHYFRKALNNFSSIGVRETSLKEILQPLTSKTIQVNLDPTLLAGVGWINKMKLVRPLEDKYVLIYELKRHDGVKRIASELSKSKNLQVKELVAFLTLSDIENLDQTASPLKFLSYIKFADYIVTTSFHGTAISILLNKDFYYVRQENDADVRIFSLLNMLGLDNRVVGMNESPLLSKIDYNVVNERLSQLRLESVNYLINAIEE